MVRAEQQGGQVHVAVTKTVTHNCYTQRLQDSQVPHTHPNQLLASTDELCAVEGGYMHVRPAKAIGPQNRDK